MEITEKMVEGVRVAYGECSGSYDRIPQYIAEVAEWVIENGLQMTGRVYGTYYNSPEDVSEDELVYEIGVSIAGEAEPSEKIKIKNLPAHRVLATLHEGPYTEVGPAIHALIDYAIENGYEITGPVTEVYLNSPLEVDESELLTEVQIPVKKPD
ncbi:GyrI-like domain-containing protein [Methanothermobacter sp.]|uniref:GyrI-like domain-containing protein n=1 Tax=Methanothermobacter sp. TaxID=1884223 RepID=UPI00262BB4C8|nr:GyrI-like domain-containing protein [Methanothermobacter sp.]MDI9614045.1 GyrI-like domain-containing protein [Methanothermobacter sp.]